MYHLFYADEEGSPGSDLTFFEYPGAARGQTGPGCAYRVVWRVGSPDALEFWADRLASLAVPREIEPASVRLADPEGLEHELVVEDVPDAPLRVRHPEIPPEHALLGFSGVRAYSMRPDASRALLTDVLAGGQIDDETLEVRGAKRGATIRLDPAPETRLIQGGRLDPPHRLGHDAGRASAVVAHVNAAGVRSTPIIDRHFFHSIYFREPGGDLYEIADDGPGFTGDVPVSELGRSVVLPSWLEARRSEIESRLTPLPDPRAGWPAGEPSG